MLGTAPLAITEGGGTLPLTVPSTAAGVSGRSVEDVVSWTACSTGLEEGFQVGLWTPSGRRRGITTTRWKGELVDC